MAPRNSFLFRKSGPNKYHCPHCKRLGAIDINYDNPTGYENDYSFAFECRLCGYKWGRKKEILAEER